MSEQSVPVRSETEMGAIIRDLARFRFALRKFLRFSEDTARQCGVTPQQHQLMLGVAGYSGGGSATISELAEFLRERVHSVVGLVERAELNGLVRTKRSDEDHRVVVVSLTRRGEMTLSRVCRIHYEEVRRIAGFLESCNIPSPSHSDRK